MVWRLMMDWLVMRSLMVDWSSMERCWLVVDLTNCLVMNLVNWCVMNVVWGIVMSWNNDGIVRWSMNIMNGVMVLFIVVDVWLIVLVLREMCWLKMSMVSMVILIMILVDVVEVRVGLNVRHGLP
jgi:hypothetical protein